MAWWEGCEGIQQHHGREGCYKEGQVPVLQVHDGVEEYVPWCACAPGLRVCIHVVHHIEEGALNTMGLLLHDDRIPLHEQLIVEESTIW